MKKILEGLPGEEPEVERLGRAAGFRPHQDLRLVRKWLSGDTRPSFEYLVPMLSRAGLLHEKAVRAYWADGDSRRELEAARRALEARAAPSASSKRIQGG